MNYIQKGATLKGGGFIYSDEAHMNYINLPILVGISAIPRKEKFSIGLEAGLGINIEIENQSNLGKGLAPGSSTEYKSPLSLNLGGNMEYKVENNISVFLNYRYYKDLDSFFERKIGNSSYDLWHVGSSISVGLLFNPKSIN